MRLQRILIPCLAITICLKVTTSLTSQAGSASSSSRRDPVQYAEGFTRIIWAPGLAAAGASLDNVKGEDSMSRARATLDYRGPTRSWWTMEWWRHPDKVKDPYQLVWETAIPQRQIDTIFSFVAASSNRPDHEDVAVRAKIYLNDKYLMTFPLGTRLRQRWSEGNTSLEFIPKHVQMPFDGYHRQFQPYGNSGLYQLKVPGRQVRVGVPNLIKVAVEPSADASPAWFAIHDRSDTLKDGPEVHAQQIGQLQQEIIQLKRMVNVLARQAYPELEPNKLPAERVIVCAQGRSHVHDANVVRLQNGDILSVFRQGLEHLSDDGRLVIVRSADNGRTWSQPQIVVGRPRLDAREATLSLLRNGTLLLTSYPDLYYDESGGRDKAGLVLKVKTRVEVLRSRDNGHTWEPWSVIDPAPFVRFMPSRGSVVELPDGRILLPAQTIDQRYREGSAVFASDDEGKSWRFFSMIALEKEENDLNQALSNFVGDYSEPTLTLTSSGRILAMMRMAYENHALAVSEDGGKTWGEPQVTSLESVGHPAHLITLTNGDILCAYGHRQKINFMSPDAAPLKLQQSFFNLDEPSWIGIAISKDEGKTWPKDKRYLLRDDLVNLDIGYPVSAQLPDGRILTLYYYNLLDRFVIEGSMYHLPK